MNLLDTGHCIAILREHLDLRRYIRPEAELATTTIRVAESTHGAYRSKPHEDKMARLEVLLSAPIISLLTK